MNFFGTARSQPNSGSRGRSTPPFRPRCLASDIAVRQAKSEDLRTLAEILAASFHETQGWRTWFLPLIRLGIYEDLRHRLRASHHPHTCLVASLGDLPGTEVPWLASGDHLLGTVELSLKSSPPTAWRVSGLSYPYISNLAVRPQARRCGVARQLLMACEQTALEWGFREVYLHVLDNNLPARALYTQLGYRLRRVELTWGTTWFGKPRQLFLSKSLIHP
ncbi:MAG: GNAT family N-acetyltransferase [Phormidium sp. BM_Day4_Bin.17]|nr:GNAT family N-acetyltransferase [Phormidium sp. BM_Day4_Bin.17]UCJ13269.1 MAG: GNAT family N-acetyltransferase [Phormidium sp. PBR-2020]